MQEMNECEEATGTEIQWTPGSDVTKTKKKKGKGKNKKTVVVKAESFFNFFETVGKSVDEATGDSDDEEDAGDMQLEDDLDLGSTIRDDLVPLALEYYLNVIPQEDEVDSGDSDEDGSHGSDEDIVVENSKPGKKGKGGAPPPKSGAGDSKKEQECKQQ